MMPSDAPMKPCRASSGRLRSPPCSANTTRASAPEAAATAAMRAADADPRSGLQAKRYSAWLGGEQSEASHAPAWMAPRQALACGARGRSTRLIGCRTGDPDDEAHRHPSADPRRRGGTPRPPCPSARAPADRCAAGGREVAAQERPGRRGGHRGADALARWTVDGEAVRWRSPRPGCAPSARRRRPTA